MHYIFTLKFYEIENIFFKYYNIILISRKQFVFSRYYNINTLLSYFSG